MLGLALLPINAYWLIYVETTRHAHLGNSAPFAHVIFVLLVLAGANALVRRWRPSVALAPIELLTVYAMLSVGSSLASIHHLHNLVGGIGYPFWFATPSNKFEQSYLPNLPEWATVRDKTALYGYYFGNTSLYDPAHFGPWLRPLGWWGLYLVVLGWVTLAISVLFRRPWVQMERLTFPITELPLAIARSAQPGLPGRSSLANPVLWAGAALAGGVELLNGLHYLNPAIPEIYTKRTNLAPMFTERPWNAIGETNLSWYPFAFGLSFVMPLDLSVSCWVFFLLHKAQRIAGAALGYDNLDPHFPYTKDQQWGACLAILLVTLWTSRRHLAGIYTGRLPGASGPERRLVNVARLTVPVGVGLLIGFGWAAGFPLWVSAFFVGVLLVVGFIATRLRAEMGFFVHDMYRMGPAHTLLTLFGGNQLGPRTDMLLGLFTTTHRQFSGFVQPHQLEALKLADRASPSGGPDAATRLSWVVGLAVLVAVPSAFWADLHLFYQRGAATAKGLPDGMAAASIFRSVIPEWLNDIYGHSHRMSLVAGTLGFLVTLGLYALRLRGSAWSIHPLGLAVANTWGGIVDVFTCILFASLTKALVLRYGGMHGYRKVLPFFLGLMIGDFLVGPGWLLVGTLLDIPTYVFFL
jgi:hypothetical protein